MLSSNIDCLLINKEFRSFQTRRKKQMQKQRKKEDHLQKGETSKRDNLRQEEIDKNKDDGNGR